MTSVGSGSLMIIFLLFLYPMLIRSRPWEGVSRPRDLEAGDITPQRP